MATRIESSAGGEKCSFLPEVSLGSREREGQKPACRRQHPEIYWDQRRRQGQGSLERGKSHEENQI